MTSLVFRQRLEAALKLELPYADRPPSLPGTPASVLVLVGSDAPHDDPAILITRRTEHVETHKGQMAFPGGMREPGESDTDAALRETEEEVGIPRENVQVLGQLPQLWTITGFSVTPIVGILTTPISKTPIVMNEAEIAETLWVSLRTLGSPETYRQEWIEHGAVRHPIHAYYVGQDHSLRIWGATGTMIHGFLARLEQASRAGVFA